MIIDVVKSVERDETEEEKKKRQADEEKSKKKAPAKAKKGEDNVKRVKEVCIENLDMANVHLNMPLYVRWVSSQLQFIKDRSIRDAYSKDPIWKKIYPQVDGTPIYNPHGQYWVKLYHLGAEILVDIDDTMPCDQKKRLIMPVSMYSFEIWPCLLTKAIIKLYGYQWGHPQNITPEVGDPTIIYALTGMMCEKIELRTFHDKWAVIKKLLSEDYYFNKKAYLCAYCSSDFKPKLPSSHKYFKAAYEKEKNSTKEEEKKDSSNAGAASTADSQSVEGYLSSLGIGSHLSGPKTIAKMRKLARLAVFITTGKRLKDPIAERDAFVLSGFAYSILDLFDNEWLDMSYVVKEDRELIEEIKSPFSPKRRRGKAKEEKKDKERKDSNSPSPQPKPKKGLKKYQFVKVKSAIGNCPIPNIVCPFTNDEIRAAKKCLMNKWEKPPGYDARMTALYEELRKVKGKKEVEQKADEEKKEEDPNSFITPAKDKVEGSKNPKTRAPGGLWMDASDFPCCFQYILAFYNPRSFKNKEIIRDIWEDSKVAFPINEYCIVLKNSVDRAVEEPINPEFKDIEIDINDEKSKIYYGYAPHYGVADVKQRLPLSFCNLIDGKSTLPMNSIISGFQINSLIAGDHMVVKPNIFAPFGFSFFVMSNYTIEKMSRIEYESKYQGFIKKEVELQYPVLQKNKYHLLGKYLIDITDDSTDIILSFAGTDHYLMQYMSYKISLKSSKDNIGKCEAYNPVELGLPQTKRTHLSSGKYILSIHIRPPYNAAEGKLTIHYLATKEVPNLAQIPFDEPQEFGDMYIPYKYGTIFREILSSSEESSLSLHIYLRRKTDKGFEPIAEPKRIFIELLYGGERIIKYYGHNEIIIHHVNLFVAESGKKFVLVCGFDMQEWPDCTKASDATKNIQWAIRMYSSIQTSIIKDTEKEEIEDKIIQSWEEKESGRKDKATKSREKYLLTLKLEKGEKLTEDELALVNAKRQLKKDTASDPKKNEKQKQPAKSKDTKKKDEEPQEEKKEEQITIPKSTDHFNDIIVNFIKHFEENRTKVAESEKSSLRTEEDKKKLQEDLTKAISEHDKNIKQDEAAFEELKKTFGKVYDDEKKAFGEEREKYFKEIEKVLEERMTYKKLITDRKQKEKEDKEKAEEETKETKAK